MLHFDGDELYVGFIWEDDMRKRFTALHPSQLLFSVTEPGLSSEIGLLKQNWVMLEAYSEDDPDIAYYEEV